MSEDKRWEEAFETAQNSLVSVEQSANMLVELAGSLRDIGLFPLADKIEGMGNAIDGQRQVIRSKVCELNRLRNVDYPESEGWMRRPFSESYLVSMMHEAADIPDVEYRHIRMDNVMKLALQELGYARAVAIFENRLKYYA